MGKLNWVLFVAARHNVFLNRKRRGGSSHVFAILGIAVGVMALVVIIAVMNGLQLGFIENILEISSFHLRARGSGDAGVVLEDVRKVPSVSSAIPFRELHCILRGERNSQEGALIRGLSPDALEEDKGMAQRLVFEDGSFDIAKKRSILLGAELARVLGVRIGGTVHLVSISDLFGDEDNAWTVTGVFRTGFYEYDLGWGFINIDAAAELDNGSLLIGVKLTNRWQDSRALSHLRSLPNSKDIEWTSWRVYNRAFFSALRSEKLLMFVLVGLIFLVVGLNIFQAQRRFVLERREEIGLLRAIGASEWSVRLVFLWDGFIIGFIGAVSGALIGLFLATHINGFFTALEKVVNLFIHALNFIVGLFGRQSIGDFAIFSPTVFYLREIPSRVIPYEVTLIFLFGFLSALFAAGFAARRATKMRPAEVLREE
ncbi:MAG: ABC transporter permease [Treponema sp.]|jgi:lipoprotein-releasing system permease protein|nr:ABC transporter permease [Treponema sp.]